MGESLGSGLSRRSVGGGTLALAGGGVTNLAPDVTNLAPDVKNLAPDGGGTGGGCGG